MHSSAAWLSIVSSLCCHFRFRQSENPLTQQTKPLKHLCSLNTLTLCTVSIHLIMLAPSTGPFLHLRPLTLLSQISHVCVHF